jgi:hypothetical protein
MYYTLQTTVHSECDISVCSYISMYYKLQTTVHSGCDIYVLFIDEVKKITEENREMKDQTQCKICCEETVSIVFLPCGHLTACTQCAPALIMI